MPYLMKALAIVGKVIAPLWNGGTAKAGH